MPKTGSGYYTDELGLGRRRRGGHLTVSWAKCRFHLPSSLTLAGVAGFEPATPGFGDRCSGQLSYTPRRTHYNMGAGDLRYPRTPALRGEPATGRRARAALPRGDGRLLFPLARLSPAVQLGAHDGDGDVDVRRALALAVLHERAGGHELIESAGRLQG